MTGLSDNELYDLELVLVTLFCGVFLIALAVRLLERTRPSLTIRRIIYIAFGVRIIAALAVSNLSAAAQLRGGDELTFLTNARGLARWDLVSVRSLDVLVDQFHVFAFSVDFQLFGRAPDMMLRIQVITLATLGVAFLVAAVYELAGARAAVVTAWVLALEPTNVFFSGILHKEPFMLCAEGLVAFGGAILWKRGRLEALVPLVLGCLLATATRPYVGWFLTAAAAALTLHASVRHKQQLTSVALGIVVLGLAVWFVPAVWNASSSKNLEALQASQDANAADTVSNLALERVDYSTREKLILNLPQRMFDIATRPYPWQVGNVSQQLGVFGTLSLWLLLVMVASALSQNGRALFRRAGPLLYPLFFLFVAYSISAGNAGTAFRYRTHLVAFLIALLLTLRHAPARAGTADTAQAPMARKPIVAGVR